MPDISTDQGQSGSQAARATPRVKGQAMGTEVKMPLVRVPLTQSNVKGIVAIDYGENVEEEWNEYGDKPMMDEED
jgi:hypothetical protein